MSNRRYRKIEPDQQAERFSPGIARAGAILANETREENARLAFAQGELFSPRRVTLATLAFAFVKAHARLAAAILALAAALAILAMLSGCSSDPVARQIIERQAEYWEQDHRPELDDAAFVQLPPSQRAFFMPASLAAARRFALNQGKAYARD